MNLFRIACRLAAAPLNDVTCPWCKNPKCGSDEKTCWKCGGKLPVKDTEPKPVYSKKDVHCLWPLNKGEVGGDVERSFDIYVYDLAPDVWKIKLKLVKGPELDSGSPFELIFDEYRNVENDHTMSGFVDYILMNSGYPEDST